MILGIVGSYRRDGTIDQAVSSVLAAAQSRGAETKKIYLLDFHLELCRNCRLCTQEPGTTPGQCPLEDDMPQLIAVLENADGYVIGAPVNVGSVNALTQRFLERLVCYAYWPWGQASPGMRKADAASKKAVLITSSAMPAIMGRLMTGSLKGLKLGAKMLGAKPVAKLFIGLSAMQQHQQLPIKVLRKTDRAAEALMRPKAGFLKRGR